MVKKLPFYVNYISIKSCLLEILSWLYSHWYLGYWVVLVIYCCIINYHGLGGLKRYIYYLTVYVGQNSRYNVTEFFASWSLTRLQSRGQPGLESHLKVPSGKDQLPVLYGCWQNSLPCQTVFLRTSVLFWLSAVPCKKVFSIGSL